MSTFTDIARPSTKSALTVLLMAVVGCGHDWHKPSAAWNNTQQTPSSTERQLVARQATERESLARRPSVNGEKWANSALILIDVQRGFWDEKLAAQNTHFPSNVAALRSICHSEGIDVIHVRTRFDADKSKRLPSFNAIFGDEIPCIDGTTDVQPLSFARESSGDRVFFKSSFDAFTNAEFVACLHEHGKTHIFLAGLTTDVCVLSTGLSAVNNGFLATLVTDCCASHPAAHQFVAARYDRFVFDTVTQSELVSQRYRW